jgi:hypothetical protein
MNEPIPHLPPTLPPTLLIHDGELADVRDLLEELGASFVDRRGATRPEEQRQSFQLVIATPPRLLGLFPPGEPRPKQIAICNSDSKGLRSSLHRAGIQLMVRRPVHRTALRGLLLHSLYQGPEKRRSVRVNIGAPVHFRSGWRRRPAVLTDLSVGGCRVLTPRPVAPGTSITLAISAKLSGSRRFSVKGRVLRNLTVKNSDWHSVIARFVRLGADQERLLRATIDVYASGPATFEQERLAVPDAAVMGLPGAAPEIAAKPPAPSAVESAERRTAPRYEIDRRVIALSEESARVLVGRDISLGGMRVDPSPLLVVGQDVRLAIHFGNQEVPLVVTARVHRDDAERGVVLRFHGLDPDTARRLNEMLDTLPMLDPGATGSAGMIISEIVADAGYS